MKHKRLNLLILFCVATLVSGCKENESVAPSPSIKSIRYYPQGEGYTWTYSVLSVKASDTSWRLTTDYYNLDKGWIEGEGLRPSLDIEGRICGDSSLCGYSQLFLASFSDYTSTEDSVVLSSAEFGTTITTFKFKDEVTVNLARNYKTIKCKKALLISHRVGTNDTTFIYRLYAPNIGLLYQHSIDFKNNKIESETLKILESHNFVFK